MLARHSQGTVPRQRQHHRRYARILVNLATILGTFAGYAGGLATEWVKQWASAWFARHEIRGAVRAEIGGVLITLNFFIMSALETGAAEDVVLKYFPAPAHLESFQFYWNQKRDRAGSCRGPPPRKPNQGTRSGSLSR